MSTSNRRQSSSRASSSRETRSRRSDDSYGSHSTDPTSVYTSPRPSDLKASEPSTSYAYANRTKYAPQSRHDRHADEQEEQEEEDDGEEQVSYGAPMMESPLSSASSIATYASTTASEEDLYPEEAGSSPCMDDEDVSIPPLPVYRREMVEPNVRPSTPQDFAKLFPSLNRLTIRHDEFTPDGNMNLRVDTVVTGRRRTAIQLFHLRMYDLARREFSLRRYCRDSGREVCNSKRKYNEPPKQRSEKLAASTSTATTTTATAGNGAAPTDARPTLQRSMSTALRTLGGAARPVFRRNSSACTAAAAIAARNTGSASGRRPGTAGGASSYDDEAAVYDAVAAELFDADKHKNQSRESLYSHMTTASSKKAPKKPQPTDTIKLEFSNYARVDVRRRGGRRGGANARRLRYDFEWWGHRYSWRRAVDKQLGLVSFHLVRDGREAAPVAHIVPETRSPSQVYADEAAGGWVPPCFMWIADDAVVDAVTDVADVIMATGLIALVDDCIRERWQTKKVHHIPVPLTSRTVSLESVGPKTLMRHVFGRRNSDHHHHASSPLRFANPISAY